MTGTDNRLKPRLFLLLGILLCFAADQWVKSVVVKNFALGESLPVWDEVFHLTYVQNTGAAFSVLEQYPFLLSVVSSFIFMVLLIYALRFPRLTPFYTIVFTLILGGALGNLWDRWTLGVVIDYLDFVVIHYPVFNLADSFICVGSVLWIAAHFWLEPRVQSSSVIS